MPYKCANRAFFFRQGAFDFAPQQFREGQVPGPDAYTGRFVLVARADAPACRADLGFTAAGRFPGRVQALVVGHDEVGPGTQHEPVGTKGHAPRGQGVHFPAEDLGVQDHPVAYKTLLPRVQGSGGNEVQNEFLVPHHHRVAGVVAALETHQNVRILGQEINEFSLALVPPLGPYDNDIRHSAPRIRDVRHMAVACRADARRRFALDGEKLFVLRNPCSKVNPGGSLLPILN